ncbi:hypothetical protein ACFQ1I_07505 [Kitasatospora arboriphila]
MPSVRGGMNAQASSACRVIGRLRTASAITSLNAAFEITTSAVSEASVRHRSCTAGPGAAAATRSTPIRSTPSTSGSHSSTRPSADDSCGFIVRYAQPARVPSTGTPASSVPGPRGRSSGSGTRRTCWTSAR